MTQTRSMSSRAENAAEGAGGNVETAAETQRRLAATETGIAEMIRRMEDMAVTLEQLRGSGNGGWHRQARNRNSGEHSDGSDGDNRRRRVRNDNHRKLEIPIFVGTEAHAWLSKVERYFRVNEIEETEKIGAVMVFMEGSALTWFQWWEMRNPQTTWNQFRRELLNRFQPETMDNPFGPLYSLKQTGTVAEFQAEFERVVSMMRYEDEEFLKGAWLNGLRPCIREELLLYPLFRVADMIRLALKLERRNQAWIDDGLFKSGTKSGEGGKTSSYKGGWQKGLSWQMGSNVNKPNAPSGSQTVANGSQSLESVNQDRKMMREKTTESTANRSQHLTTEEVIDRRKKDSVLRVRVGGTRRTSAQGRRSCIS